MTEIRSYANSDREAVVELALRAWEPVHASMRRVLGEMLYRRLIPDWRESRRATVTEDLDSDSSHVWVAVREDAVAGFAAVHLEPDDKTGEVHLVAVDPDHQGRGVGRALIDHATVWIGEQGMRTAPVATQAALCTTRPSSTVSHAFTSRNRSGASVRTSASSTTRSAR